MKKKTNLGFTIIELMIVVVIISLLAVFILYALNNARIKARDLKRTTDLRAVAIGLAFYHEQNKIYPGTPGSNQWQTLTEVLEGSEGKVYLKSVPADPGVYTYEYRVSDTRQSYVLRAKLEDSKNPSLKDDMDNVVLGIDCEDDGNYYCIYVK